MTSRRPPKIAVLEAVVDREVEAYKLNLTAPSDDDGIRRHALDCILRHYIQMLTKPRAFDLTPAGLRDAAGERPHARMRITTELSHTGKCDTTYERLFSPEDDCDGHTEKQLIDRAGLLLSAKILRSSDWRGAE